MGKIKIMSEQLSNRIAAGEVIERPASVVKELVENAIDAGARKIRIAVERAGSRLIEVADDGCGMDEEDSRLSLEPHGTSKLLREEDIDCIATLGFRGEALPSIASVSCLTLTSRTAEALEGTRIVVEGGTIVSASPCGGAVGTTVLVRDLFFNTPARKKFLKSDATEAHHIEETVLSLAIPRPEIAFELVMEGKSVLRSPASENASARLREWFGRSYADSLWPCLHRENGMEISGFIAAPGFTRNSRREQRTFVNGRAVESPAIYRGIRDGYATLEENGRFPPVILFLFMPPNDVDVNVHPAKREVRFRHEYAVSRAVAAAIGSALRRSREPGDRRREEELPLSGKVPLRMVLDSAAVQYEPRRSGEVEKMEILPLPIARTSGEEEPSPFRYTESSPKESALPSPLGKAPARNHQEAPSVPQEETEDPVPFLRDAAPGTEWEEEPSPNASSPSPLPFGEEWPSAILGVLDNTYLLASGKTGLVLIDQHAAHERILFERLLDAARKSGASQALLLPRTIELPQTTVSLLLRSRRRFEEIGFDLEPLGSRTVMLNAVPAALQDSRNLEVLIPDMLQELQETIEHKLPIDLEAVARAACRAAVKAHDALSFQAAEELLRELQACRQGTLCPHGRPTMITIPLKEIEKRFSRR